MTRTERDREIREIERELTNLHRRYANLDRAARCLRTAYYVVIIVLAELVVIGAVLGHLAVSFDVAVVLFIVLLFAWAAGRLYPGRRLWIDHVGWHPEGWIKQTEAMAIERMVAERLERLAALKGHDE